MTAEAGLGLEISPRLWGPPPKKEKHLLVQPCHKRYIVLILILTILLAVQPK